MPRTLSEIKKKKWSQHLKGVNLDELSILYKLKVITIKKHLKNSLGEIEFKKTINLNKLKKYMLNLQMDMKGKKELKFKMIKTFLRFLLSMKHMISALERILLPNL